jgi:6-pyruvoyl-tetrahydropterin synthase
MSRLVLKNNFRELKEKANEMIKDIEIKFNNDIPKDFKDKLDTLINISKINEDKITKYGSYSKKYLYIIGIESALLLISFVINFILFFR